jgi:pyruvate formate lyase activating enzyme
LKREATLYEKCEGEAVRCNLCSHRCRIEESHYGFCGVRQNIAGTLYTLVYAEAIASHVDPIEKKPLYHFLPGTKSYSIATIGCNFHCGFCQNWQISQISKRDGDAYRIRELPPEQVVKEAVKSGSGSISYTYTEPTIFFEYARDTAELARREGLRNVFVTNGYMTPEALDAMKPWLDAANVDLKSFRDDFYGKNCKARLQPVLDSIRYMKELGIWVEVTTLIIPEENDSREELEDIAAFIARTGVEIPWHISRFHPDNEFTDHAATPIETMRAARDIGKAHGLRYVYLGNVLEGSDMYCYRCQELLLGRRGYLTGRPSLDGGKCPACGAEIHGIWS